MRDIRAPKEAGISTFSRRGPVFQEREQHIPFCPFLSTQPCLRQDYRPCLAVVRGLSPFMIRVLGDLT